MDDRAQPPRLVRRTLPVLALVAVAVSTLSAAGVGLTVGTGSLAAGAATVATCQSATLTVGSAVVNGSDQVTQVTVGNIQPSCQGTGTRLHVTLTNASNVALASSTVSPISAASVNVTFSPGAPRAQVAKFFVAIVGP